jgi:hypothetical protein
MMLASKLEAIDVYQEYAQDMEDGEAEVLRRIEADDRQHVELLIDQIEASVRKNGLRPGGSRGGGGGR